MVPIKFTVLWRVLIAVRPREESGGRARSTVLKDWRRLEIKKMGEKVTIAALFPDDHKSDQAAQTPTWHAASHPAGSRD